VEIILAIKTKNFSIIRLLIFFVKEKFLRELNLNISTNRLVFKMSDNPIDFIKLK
jgi:hypothetical protein